MRGLAWRGGQAQDGERLSGLGGGGGGGGGESVLRASQREGGLEGGPGIGAVPRPRFAG